MAANTYLSNFGGNYYPNMPYTAGNPQGPGGYPMQNPQPQPAPMMQPQQPSYKVQPVTDREEALAVPVDYFGPGTILPDLAHGVVYLKRFNQQTGASDFLEFLYAPAQAKAEPQPVDLAPVWERIAALEAEMEKLKPTPTKGGKKNVSDAE